LLGHIELDWFNAGLFKPDERCLGKLVSIPAHRNSIFLAGTILAEKVELGSVHKVSAALTITVNTPEDHPPKGTLTRPLLELYDGGSLEIDLVFSWERDYAQEQTFRYQLQVKSFGEICFTQIR